MSITLQRDQFKAKSLLDKKEEIYAPLLRSVISFIQQLEARPYPWQIAHIGGALSFSLQPQAGFLTWSDIVSSGEVISVPSWLRRAFEALGANLDEYNRQVRACSHQIERSLIEELKERGLIESASGFSEISLILAEEYEARVITPFSQMKHPEGAGNRTQEEIAPLLPQLFREYGQLPAIEAIRVFYAEEVVDRARWLRRALENVIRLIELSYGSRDPHL